MAVKIFCWFVFCMVLVVISWLKTIFSYTCQFGCEISVLIIIIIILHVKLLSCPGFLFFFREKSMSFECHLPLMIICFPQPKAHWKEMIPQLHSSLFWLCILMNKAWLVSYQNLFESRNTVTFIMHKQVGSSPNCIALICDMKVGRCGDPTFHDWINPILYPGVHQGWNPSPGAPLESKEPP